MRAGSETSHVWAATVRRVAWLGVALWLALPGRLEAQAAGLCDAQAVQAALDQASPGDTVLIGACTVAGPLTVPAGVELRGLAPGLSRIEAGSGQVGVYLQAGSQPAELEHVTVRSQGRAAVWADAAGAADASGGVEIEHVRIRSTVGLGVVLDGIGWAELRHVDLRGPVDPSQPEAIAWDSDASASATHGLVLRGVGQAVLEHVTARRWVHEGVLAVDANVAWHHGAARHNTGAGFVQWGGSSDLRHVAFVGQLRGDRPPTAHLPAGAVFGGGASVQGRWLRVARNEGWGLAHDGVASADYGRLVARRNAAAAIWALNGGVLDVRDALLDRNGYGGVVLRDVQSASLHRAVVSRSGGAPVPNIGAGGDGIQAFETPLDLTDVLLLRNARAGLLALQAASEPFDPQGAVQPTRVLVAGRGDALGAITLKEDGTQAATIAGVTRLGVLLTNDQAFAQLPNYLEHVLGGYRPNYLPQAQAVALYGVGFLYDGQQGGGGGGGGGDPFPFPGN